MPRFLLSVAFSALTALPALAEMGPDMTCLDFTNLKVTGSVRAQQDATQILKEAAAAAGTLPAKLAAESSVVGLAAAIDNRCQTQPDMPAMEAIMPRRPVVWRRARSSLS